MNLLDSVKGVMTNAVVDKAASALGIENGMMKSAIKLAIPAIIGGLINKGSTESGAGGLIDLFKKGGYGDANNSDLTGVLGDDDKRGGMLETGTDLLRTIFGGNQSGILDMILKSTGIGKSGGSSILSFLAPIVVNKLAGMVFGNNMSASGLSKFLGEQKSDIMGLVPGLSSMLGGSNALKDSGVATSVTNNDSDNSGGGMGFLKYLIPLLFIGALIYWWMNKDKSVEQEADKIEVSADKTASNNAAKTTIKTVKNAENVDNTLPSTFTLNSNGDVINGNGAIVFAAGSYEFDQKGNLIDKKIKRIILPAGSISRDLRDKLSALLYGLSKTVTSADMQTLFGDMIMKKSNKTSYALSNIEFNTQDHKISNFSKAEVMGLAGALKENVNGKIEVQVYTMDGKNDKENNSLSDTRANVIRDMLVTLGVDKKQISAKGMGASDAEKAKFGKVDVVIK